MIKTAAGSPIFEDSAAVKMKGRSIFMNSPICWIGGKKLLRKQIISMFPEKIDRYIEVFGGDRRTFGCNRKNLGNAMEQLPEVSKRLNGVVIEHKDFEDLIKVYDRPGALFYCDPPYHTTEDMYVVVFTEDDHRRLRDALSRIKGRFLLSYNDDEFVRELYSGFEITAVERSNNLASGRYKEIIVKNY